MANERDNAVGQAHSRRYCFVIMPYNSLGLFYDHLKRAIAEATGLVCVRADEVPEGGEPLLDKIHRLIAGAELAVVELSEKSPNVYYEVGYVKALGKKVLVVCRKGTEIPTDLQGLERIEYVDTPNEWPQFDLRLRQHLVAMIDPDIRLLQAMLVAPAPSPSYILASPRWQSHSPEGQGPGERRTYGDYLGVVGVLYALGTLLVKEQLPELLSAQHVNADFLLKQDGNLYLIGSPRSNPVVAEALAKVQQGREKAWRFEHDPESQVTTLTNGDRWACKGYHQVLHPDEDFGLVLRGPHWLNPMRQILFMGGTRSLGTGAACLAATRAPFIQEIQNRLRTADLEDKSKIIWALVRGRPDPKDGHVSPDPKYVRIEDAGVLESHEQRRSP